MDKQTHIIWACISLCLAIALYYAGVANGMTKAFRIGLDAAPTMLNITLTERAKHLANSNPELVRLVLTEESIIRLGLSLKRSAEVKGGLGPDRVGSNFTLK